MELHLKWNLGILACFHRPRIITAIDCWLPTSRPSQIIYFQCDYKWKYLNLICTICHHSHSSTLDKNICVNCCVALGFCCVNERIERGEKQPENKIEICLNYTLCHTNYITISVAWAALAVLYPNFALLLLSCFSSHHFRLNGSTAFPTWIANIIHLVQSFFVIFLYSLILRLLARVRFLSPCPIYINSKSFTANVKFNIIIH